MKFLEDTGKNWAAVQLRAVEMEIEQQKLEWEEKRQVQRQQEELEKQRADNEENEILTYSRDDALNKVNITTKKLMLGKRKSEIANNSSQSNAHGKKNNGTKATQNGISKETSTKSRKSLSNIADVPRRNTRNSLNRSAGDDKLRARRSSPSIMPQRGTSRKSDRSTSVHSRKSQARSTSESTSRSTANSVSRQTSTNASPDDSDSECSLDVMIDSNDVNDSDSNSNQNNVNEKMRSRLDSTSRDDTLLNDDSTMSDETTIDKLMKNRESKVASSPRTRSRGTVNVNLWTLDESSPILPVKRQKMSNKSSSESKRIEEKKIRSSFGVKECKVSIVDIKSKSMALRQAESSTMKSSSKPRVPKKLFNAKTNHTLDQWIQKPSTPLPNADTPTESVKDEPERVPITRQRRQTILMNKTL